MKPSKKSPPTVGRLFVSSLLKCKQKTYEQLCRILVARRAIEIMIPLLVFISTN